MMKRSMIVLSLGTALATLASLPCAAQSGGTTVTTQTPLKKGTTVENAAKANQRAPGDANEIAPDTKQSATGGPSGGFGRGGSGGGN